MIERAVGWARPLLFIFVAGVALSGCEPRPLTVGVGASDALVNGARLAVTDALAEGAVPGLDTIMITEGIAEAAASLGTANRLVQAPGIVAVVGHSSSPSSLAASQVYNEHGVVQIAPNATAPMYSKAGPYSFRMVPPDDRQGQFLAEQLSRLFPEGGRVGLLYINDDYGRALRASLLAHLDHASFEVVLDLPHSTAEFADTDIAYMLSALAEHRPDVVLWLSHGTLLAEVLPEIRTTLGAVPVVGGDATSYAWQDPDQNAAARYNVWHAEFFDLEATEARRSFIRRYRERFDTHPRAGHMLAYDAMRLIIAGIRDGARSPDELRAYLMSLGRERPPFSGLTGPIEFDEQGNVERAFVLFESRTEPPP